MRTSKGSYRSFNRWLWQIFQLCELVEIVQEGRNPDFAQLLNKVWEGRHANDDVIQIKDLANTNTPTWPGEFVKVYLNNYFQTKKLKIALVNQILKLLLSRLKIVIKI